MQTNGFKAGTARTQRSDSEMTLFLATVSSDSRMRQGMVGIKISPGFS